MVPAREWTGLPPEDIQMHLMNWIQCIRAGETPAGHIDLAIRAQTVLCLAEMSDRLKTTCLFDEESRRVFDGRGQQIPWLSHATA
jgi:hypothetical protein